MSKARKITLIVASALVAGGLALSFGAFAASGFNPNVLSAQAKDWRQTTLSLDPESQAAHTRIVVRENADNVRVEPADGDAIEVAYWESEQDQKTCAVTDEDGVLTVEASIGNPWLGHVGFVMTGTDYQDRATVVKVPRSWPGDVEVTTRDGRISISDLENVRTVTAASENAGNVDVARLANAGAILAQSGEGYVNLQSIRSAESIVVQTRGGDAMLADASIRGAVELRTVHGNAHASTVRAGGFYACSTDGVLLLQFVDAPTVEAHGQRGPVEADYLSAPSIAISTESGDVRASDLIGSSIDLQSSHGSIQAIAVGEAGGFYIQAASKHGTVQAPDGDRTSGNNITARTDSGDVHLSFTPTSKRTWPDSQTLAASGSESSASNPPSFPEAPEAPKAPEAPAAPTL